MTDNAEYDVVVVGAGIAGLVAANRSAEQGLKVLVLEKGTEDKYLCNSRYTGGFFHVGMQDINNTPERLREIIRAVTDDHADPALADALATDARRGIDWLKGNDIRFIRVGPDGYMSTVLAPPGLRQTGLHWEGRGGDVMLRTLGDKLAQCGGTLRRGLPAVGLHVVDGALSAVEVQDGNATRRIKTRFCVIADGGFQADPERVKVAISPRPERVVHRGAATGAGDGARMAEAIGAKLVRLDSFYGHVLHRDALKTNTLWPYPVLDMIAAAGIVIDGEGRRFCDEGRGGIYIANAIAKLADPASARVVFDRAIWEGPGTKFLLPANPYLQKAGADIFAGDSLAAVAEKAGLPGDALSQTVAGYNAALSAGSLGALTPPRSSNSYPPYAIAAAPYYVVPLAAGMTYTLGGILTDEHGRVQHRDGGAIAGLYAAGATTGGLEGGPYAGYTGGLSKSLVFGLRCAEHIAGALRADKSSAVHAH